MMVMMMMMMMMVTMLRVDAPSRLVAAQILSTQQREVSVVVGDTLTIECVASGWPVPEVTWSRYGGQLPWQRHQQLNGWLFVYLSNRDRVPGTVYSK